MMNDKMDAVKTSIILIVLGIILITLSFWIMI